MCEMIDHCEDWKNNCILLGYNTNNVSDVSNEDIILHNVKTFAKINFPKITM